MKRYLTLAIALGLSGMTACEASDDSDAMAEPSESSTAQDMKSAAPTPASTGAAGSASPVVATTDSRTGMPAPANDDKAAPMVAETRVPSATEAMAPATMVAPGTTAEPAAAAPKDIVDTAVAAGSFTQLAAALTKTKLVDALKGAGPFTVFAPSDAAFEALEKAKPGTLASLTDEKLAEVLKYHVVSGAAVKAGDLKNGQLVKTLGGPVAAIDLSGAKPTINGVTISATDIVASNGVIHVIDQVLLPPGDIVEVATAAGSFGKLAEALKAADLVATLQGEGPFTVFAPTDAAFAKLSAAPTGDALKNVLLYHVVSGNVGSADLKEGGAAMTASGSPVLFALKAGAKINDVAISTTNIVAKNGVIHVIDSVLLPPTDDIVATALAAGTFTQLAGALTSAGLVSALQGKGPFTVFAPTDEAFGKLAQVPTGDALKNVLLYHVVEGAVGSGDLKAEPVPTLLKDKSLTIDLTSGVKVNTATVTKANILTKNGIIHVVDSVLVPN